MDWRKIRSTIQAAGDGIFEQMNMTHPALGNIAGEFMSLNEDYVLNHQYKDETYKTIDILQTGFSKNQKRFLERLKLQMEDSDAE